MSSSPVLPNPPDMSLESACQMASQLYGLKSVIAQPLPSERDQNFLLDSDRGRFVLKIANPGESRQALEFQNQALSRVSRDLKQDAVPIVIETLRGESIALVEGSKGLLLVRLVSFLRGRVLAEVKPHSPALLEDLGRLLGRLDQALLDFHHPWSRREFKWDLSRAEWIGGYLHLLPAARREIVETILEGYRERLRPRFPDLRWSVIHNDANDYNILVEDRGLDGQRVSGIIDFGDMIHAPLVCEAAVAGAYVMLDKADPLAAAMSVTAGYHRVLPLKEVEVEALYDFMLARLAVSVVNSAWQRELYPNNGYLQVTDRPAWDLLEKLCRTPRELAVCRLRQACGLEPCRRSIQVVDWLRRCSSEIGPVVESAASQPYLTLDLSVGSLELGSVPDFTDSRLFSSRLFERIRQAGAKMGVGRYGEPRLLYDSPIFAAGGRGIDRRTIHIGVDLFLPPQTTVLAPLSGRVHSFRDNANPLDYGPTVVLEHEVEPGLSFHTLYGHLTRESLLGLEEGQALRKGDPVGKIGRIEENGGWPPHLHFQIICDLLGYRGDFPGVAAPSQKATWLSLSPDPNLILGFPTPTVHHEELEPRELVEIRQRRMGKSLSVSYRNPLKIVRGYLQNLYDHQGQAFLDGVNNVAHVGHCHPRVVRAASSQAATLNTNTRYLHDRLASYAERLCALFPEPLSVCFLVCSGSEANELALRLARNFTSRRDLVVLDGAYHGNTQALVEASPYKFNGPGGRGAPHFIHAAPMPDSYRGIHRGPDAGAGYAEEIAKLIESMGAQGKQPAAFLYETILGCGGQIVPPPGYLQKSQRLVREAGGVCIADEVQVGFGRVGSCFWGFELQGVVPDIVTLGKPIGNGHPMGAVVTTLEIADAFANGMEYFNTFGGNPVSCAVGLSVLDVIREEDLRANALAVGTHLKSGLQTLQKRWALIGDVRGEGLFLGIELVRDPETLDPATRETAYVVERSRELGILLSIDGPLHNVIKIKPPLVWSMDDADHLLETLDEILADDYLQV